LLLIDCHVLSKRSAVSTFHRFACERAKSPLANGRKQADVGRFGALVRA
jgi:hypothetical protein